MMQNKNALRILFILAIIAINIGFDQISKKIARSQIADHERIEIIKDHFTLTKVENTGAFLSAGDNLPEVVRIILLALFPLLVLGFCLYYLITQRDLPKATQIGICCLVGGGIGNVYDRIVYGSVTDFLFMDFVIFKTGVFNLADVSIMIGIGILLITSFKQKKTKPQQ